ncbi:MAG: tRNA glutamyl-Q(34) synthetase GluQRS [Betaproteobacteria bacterium]|nr:tRNA glutamyl-Q(34) synthetase GluQRS [Betaproteobacteria bacterium]
MYRGRFAPSPTGPLHFGSLIAAVASYLEAKTQGGEWLVRIEDLDTPRCVPGATENILCCLEAFGLQWDGAVMHQSTRNEAYRAALDQLRARNLLYGCACTRREIADSAVLGIDGPVYSGTCRNGLPQDRAARATRVHTAGAHITFNDVIQGTITQDVEHEVGDFVVHRADGLFAYQLAVVVDDAAQGITDIVRGADLLDSTPRQIWLQRLLKLATPRYAHIPVAVNRRGEKWSKQTDAPALDVKRPAATLTGALRFLAQDVPASLAHETLDNAWTWAKQHWQRRRIAATRGIRCDEP